jgi:hypothetical protein
VLGDNDALDLVRSLVDLGVLADSSTSSTTSVTAWRFVHRVHGITVGESVL